MADSDAKSDQWAKGGYFRHTVIKQCECAKTLRCEVKEKALCGEKHADCSIHL